MFVAKYSEKSQYPEIVYPQQTEIFLVRVYV